MADDAANEAEATDAITHAVAPAVPPHGTALPAAQLVEGKSQSVDRSLQGADVVIDTVGSALFPSTWRSLAQYGRWVLLGEVAGGPVELDPAEVIFRDARILGSSGVSRALVRRVAEMVSQGLAKPVLGRTLPLEEAATAYDLLTHRSVLGRVALIPSTAQPGL